MSLDAFRLSLLDASARGDLSPALKGLWWDGRGDWRRAHVCVQDAPDQDAAWVHAYLHRKEGDAENAAYWYACAGRPVAAGELDEEWQALVAALTPKGP